ncbi:glycosyltransferase [Streptomyces sp. NPDC047000]|uniref:glycosyltransferase n=1 Tax=Streptomyces sp. NPDC047000 TaxID=3155474 RepID=UPI0033C12F48
MPAAPRRSRPRLLVVGESQRHTGYARHAEGLLGALTDRWDIHQFEVRDAGLRIARPWQVHRGQVEGDGYGLVQVPLLADRLAPDALLFLHEAVLPGLHAGWLAGRGTRPAVAAVQVERTADAPEIASWLDGLDLAVVPHEPARAALVAARGPAPAVRVVPHGLTADGPETDGTGATGPGRDRDRATDRATARARLWPGRPDLASAFVVLNANRNTGRKRIDRTLAGFAGLVRAGHGHARLVLHMGRRDFGTDVIATARRLGVADRVVCTAAGDDHPDTGEAALRWLYRAADVGVNTADGESWGFVAFEHARTGAAQIVPGHDGQRAIWGDAAVLLPTGEDTMPAALTAALVRLATEPGTLREYGRRARARALDPALARPAVAAVWDRLLREAMTRRGTPC